MSSTPLDQSPNRPQSQPTVTLDLLSQLASRRTKPPPRPATSHVAQRCSTPTLTPQPAALAPPPSTHGADISSPTPPATAEAATEAEADIATTTHPNTCTIRRMPSASSRAIRAAHIILDPAAIIKELVENSLDARATRIDVRLRGKACLTSISVSDNGAGIPRTAHSDFCLPSTTSKLSSFSDLSSLSTFGFRGEALSAIRAVSSSLKIITRTATEDIATLLTIAPDGTLASTKPAARPVGTTVSLTDVFHSLPVRKKEARNNPARELARCVAVIQSLAIISTHTRLELRFASDLKVCSTPAAQLPSTPTPTTTPSLSAVRDTARSILGSRVTTALLPVTDDTIATVIIPPPLRPDSATTRATYACHALVSTAALTAQGSGGRARSSHHFFYVNARPIDLPRFPRAAAEVYRRATGLSTASPTLIVNLLLPPWACDVNLAPDKRHVLIHDEDALMAGFVRMLEGLWISTTVSAIPIQSQTMIPDSFSKAAQPATKPLPTRDSHREDGTQVDSTPSFTNCLQSNAEVCILPEGNKNNSTVKEIGESANDNNVTAEEVEVGDEYENPPESQVLEDQHMPHTLNDVDWDDADDLPILHGQPVPSPTKSASSRPFSPGNSPMQPSPPRSDATPSVLDFANRFRRGATPTSSRKRQRGTRSYGGGMDDLLSTPLDKMSHRNVLKLVEERRNRIRNAIVRPSSHTRDLTSRMVGMSSAKAAPSSELNRNPNSPLQTTMGAVMSPSADAQDNVETMTASVPKESRRSRTIREEAIPTRESRERDAHSGEEDQLLPMAIELDGEKEDSRLGAADRRTPTVHVDWDAICQQTRTSTMELSSSSQGGDECAVAGFEKASLATAGDAGTQTDDGGGQDAASRELSRLFHQEWFGKLRVIGQFNRGFIIGQLGRDVFIIDQHASDEKVNFEKLQASTVMGRQRLVHPLQLEFSTEDELLISQHLEALRSGGFDMRYDGSAPPTRRLRLVAQPVSKQTMFVEEDLRDIVDALRGGVFAHGVKVLRPPRVRAMLASRACRMSIMIGTALHGGQMRGVLRSLCEIEHPWTCPHGRPTMRHLCTLPG